MSTCQSRSVRADLQARPIPVGDASDALPMTPGLYAWWASPSVLPDFPGALNPVDPTVRLLYVGISLRPLRTRVRREHLRQTRRSTLRRALAALLRVDEGYTTTTADNGHVVLTPDDEVRLTEWMKRHLRLTWSESSNPKPIEDELIADLAPPLNVKGASSSPQRDRLVRARAAYRASVLDE